MPALSFEYTANLAIDEKIRSFLLETHQTLVEIIKTDLTTCRSSIMRVADFVIADGDPKHAFIKLTINMLPGRTEEVKNLTGKTLLKKIHTVFSEEIKQFETQIRVYLVDIDKPHYYGLV